MTRHHLIPGLRIAVAALAIPAVLAACSSGGGSLPTIPPATPTPVASEAAASPATHPGPTYPPGCPTSQPAPLPAGETRTVTMDTSAGQIVMKIDGSLSPIATGNFVALSECGYYDGVIFHRVIPNFVIQGGDGQFGRSPDVQPDLVGTGGPPYTIKDEPVTTPYKRGTIAMARTPAPDSVGSQFFVVLDDSAASSLAAANTYQILGDVVSGMEVVDAIAAAPRNASDLPNDPVVINKVTVTTP